MKGANTHSWKTNYRKVKRLLKEQRYSLR